MTNGSGLVSGHLASVVRDPSLNSPSTERNYIRVGISLRHIQMAADVDAFRFAVLQEPHRPPWFLSTSAGAHELGHAEQPVR